MSLLRRLAFLAAALPTLVFAADVPLATALDGPGLVWSTGGDVSWTGQTAIAQDATDAARATGLGALDSEAWLETTVNAPGYLSWHWRLDLGSAQASTLELLIGEDPNPALSLAQNTAWTAATLAIDDTGPIKIRWRLLRAAEAPASTPDAAFVDLVAYAPFGPPMLQSAAVVTARGFTARWTAIPLATEYAIEIAAAADFSDSRFTSPVAAPATTLSVTDLEPLTTYHYRLVAHGPEGISAFSAPLTLSTLALIPPANDAFAAATALAGPSGSVSATTINATVQPDDEPSVHRASVWFSWTAPSAGRWRFATSAASFEPVLRLYTGTTLATLETVTESDNNGDDGATFLEFDTDAGVAHRLALDVRSEAQGAVTLSWQRLALHSPPVNDTFASASTLSGNTGSLDATNLHATAESAEPVPAARSVWWRWTAPASGFWSVDAAGSAIATTLRLWSGSALASLTPLGSDSADPPAASRVGIPVVAGVTYRVSLDGQLGAEGALRLNWSFAIPTVAQTIAFPALSDLGVDAEPLLLSAASSSGLPVVITLVSGPATLGEDGVTLALTGQTGAVTLRADQPGDATRLPAPPVTRSFVVRPPPANDAIASAIAFTGASGSLSGTNLFATAAAGDPFPAARSVWWRWTAPTIGILTLDTAGGGFPAALSVLSGPSLDELDLVASDARPDATGRVSFPVAAGATYHVALDALGDRQGALRLAWSLAAPSLAQTITFAQPLPDLGVDAAPVTLAATASSELEVVFTLVSGPATLEGDQLVFTGRPGTVTVRATQTGDAIYLAAPPVTRSFGIRPPPANDDPADAVRLSGADGTVTGTNLLATAGPSDPYPAAHSVWWRWTAPSDGVWTVDTSGSAIPATLSVLSGPSPDELDLVAADVRPDAAGRVQLPVYAGETYYIALDAFADLQGALRLVWTLAPPSIEQTITFDQPLPDLVVGDGGLVLYATASSALDVSFALVSGPATLDGEFLEFNGRPGVVTLRATQAGDATHLPAPPVTRSFTVTKLPAIRITLSDLRQTYNGAPLSATATAEPAPRLTDLVVTYNGGPDLPLDAGTYTVLATADDSRATAKLVVAKAPLVVTALGQRKLAGQDNPPFTLSYAGFVGSDDESDLARPPVATSPAKKNSPGGAYPIKPSGGASANYTFTHVPGILEVDTFAGRYEALLEEPATGLPAAKLEFTVAASGAAYTGLLTLPSEPAPVAVKGELDLDAEEDSASTLLDLVRGEQSLRLALALPRLGEFSATLTRDDLVLGTTAEGVRVFAPGPKEKLPWAGAHTLVLGTPTPAADGPSGVFPAGSGHALAAIDAKGNLKLAGKLADGQPLTATLAPGTDGDYRLFTLPYPKRARSHLAGALPLTAHPTLPIRRHLPASAGRSLFWQKAPSPAKPLDPGYRAGFGPLAVAVSLEPWLPPTSTTPLAVRLGLAAAPSPFGLDFLPPAAAPITAEQLDTLPAALTLSAAGKPLLHSPNPAKLALVLDPATGAFSGSFLLTDAVAPKPVTRKVTFSGVLRQYPPAPAAAFGQGYFLLPPIPGSASSEAVSGEIRFTHPASP